MLIVFFSSASVTSPPKDYKIRSKVSSLEPLNLSALLDSFPTSRHCKFIFRKQRIARFTWHYVKLLLKQNCFHRHGFYQHTFFFQGCTGTYWMSQIINLGQFITHDYACIGVYSFTSDSPEIKHQGEHTSNVHQVQQGSQSQSKMIAAIRQRYRQRCCQTTLNKMFLFNGPWTQI